MAEMTAARAIERAEHALRTGQPNLAAIYMRRATVLVAEDHAAARRSIRRARLAKASTFELLTMAAEEIAAAVGTTVDAIVQAFAPAVNQQQRYTLAGPSKGGTHA